MDSIILNKKKYNDSKIFEKIYIEEYCNLFIYPLVGILEREAGLMSEFAEAYLSENKSIDYIIYGSREDTKFLKDNLYHFKENEDTIFTYVSESIKKFDLITLSEIVLATPNEFMDKSFFKKVNIHGLEKILYLSENASKIFDKYFHYYFENDIFNYDNLICYTMIVKNAGPLLEKVLSDNLPVIDRWCILDTGSTDGTQEIIKKVLKNKKGILHEEPFVDFKVSRNRCLELAGKSCKFILMLDDTYSIKGDLRSFLHTVRGDQFSDSFSLLIQSEDTEYYSNRIIKSETKLRYIHTIHEVITDENNVNVTVPTDKAIIFDNRADYMEKRTMDRKQFDLQLLFKEVQDFPDDPRALYYIAQTYGCIGDEINKAKYFELRINHPVQGYNQEKIDACFELARCYNFKISCVTKKELTAPLTENEWKRCEELYLQAYSLDNNRPDSLYFIGIHYYLDKNYQMAFPYFKKAFEVGYPVNSQYSLKPTLSFHFLPKFLTELCYYFKEFELGYNAASLFLTSTKFNSPQGDSWNLMSNWYKIHENLCKMGKISQTPSKLDKPIFCIVTDGGWEPWTGSDIETKGLGGSETWIVEMARYISRTEKYHVVVFCKTNKQEFYENVGYNPIEMFHQFIAKTEVQECIISRFTEYIPVAIHGYAKNVHIIFHDNLSPEIIIPVDPKIKNIWGLTEWHATQIKQIFPQFKKIISSMNYGISSDNVPEYPVKTKNKFIYSSFPNRGLIVLLKMWPKIVKMFPDATLDIFCNLEQEWVNKVVPEMMKEIKTLLKINKKGIKVHGWVAKNVLAEYYQSAEYWLYPCIFEETFCLTALEAAISKACVITNGLAALSETAKYGYTIPGNPLTQEWQDTCLKLLFGTMQENGKNNYNIHVNESYKFAKKLTWESQAMKLLNLLNEIT
jgi:glycosyltransferase involved in cell wall biosynthesis